MIKTYHPPTVQILGNSIQATAGALGGKSKEITLGSTSESLLDL